MNDGYYHRIEQRPKGQGWDGGVATTAKHHNATGHAEPNTRESRGNTPTGIARRRTGLETKLARNQHSGVSPRTEEHRFVGKIFDVSLGQLADDWGACKRRTARRYGCDLAERAPSQTLGARGPGTCDYILRTLRGLVKFTCISIAENT